MKLYFINNEISTLSDDNCFILKNTKEAILSKSEIEEVFEPSLADAILIEEKVSFKNFKYISALLNDPIISKFPEKIFTINSDDCATGLLRGLYTCIPKYRFNPQIYVAVPYM